MSTDRAPDSVDCAPGEENDTTSPSGFGIRSTGSAQAKTAMRGVFASSSDMTSAASERPSLRSFLAGYDAEVAETFEKARAAESGLERVRALHNVVRPALVVHDGVLASVLCPLLEELPGGNVVSEHLRSGCRERAQLLARFEAVSQHVAAQNVYPVSGEEVEDVLEGLERSFAAHVEHETNTVSGLLESTTSTGGPDAIATAMALRAPKVPTRHPAATLRHRSHVLEALRRSMDRLEDWSDAHRGWSEVANEVRSPRQELVHALERGAGASAPSVRSVLEGYDAAVDAILAELRTAKSPEHEARSAHRIVAAIAIHDSVVGGVLCPLLEAVPGGNATGAQLRKGCLERSIFLQRWDALVHEVHLAELYRLRRHEAEQIMGQLIECFAAHEREETLQIEALLAPLPDDAYRTKSSPLDDVMWPWHSGGPEVLALHMALWGESAPTRAHRAMLRHPSSRILRSLYHLVDRLRDHWPDTWLERWLFPDLPHSGLPQSGDAAGSSQPPRDSS